MWKYVTRRLRDTFERSVNHLEKRSAVGIVSAGNGPEQEDKPAHSCRWINSQKCWTSSQGDSDTNSNKWNFEHLNRNWIGAITWSSALVVGWYTSQLIHFKLKYRSGENTCSAKNNLLSPYIQCINPVYLKSVSKIEKIIGNVTPTVHLMSNGHDGDTKTDSSGGSSGSSSGAEDALGDVLNSIENRLGLAAIEKGQHQEGLNLLRSAANRHHAPALYNLGLCYEIGLGVSADEKIAMELFRSAAALEHPGALYNLGVYYGQGRGGLARDASTAARLLRLAAARGQPDAAKALASIDADGPSQSYPFPAPEPFTPTTLLMQNIGYTFPNSDGTAY